ncbi:Elongation factor 1-beta [Trichinella sp. T6]|nr:Elongation factor 1-beta [Trichinella sp. T6]
MRASHHLKALRSLQRRNTCAAINHRQLFTTSKVKKMNFGEPSSRLFVLGLLALYRYFPSSADVQTFNQIKNPPTTLHHLQRWFHHIASFTDAERAKWPKCSSEPVASAEGDDEDIDLFGSSSEEEDSEEKKRVRQERLDAYAAKKAKKPVAVAKSNIILDVKPWDDETDLKLMEESIRNITTDGLIWGPSKILPVAYGVKKLQIGCVVEDDKVGTDFLEENILALEDLVQSVDIVAFNKI